MAIADDPGGGGLDLSDIPRANAGMLGTTSSPTYGDETLAWPIYVGDKERHEYDAREAKVADQLGETYGGYITSQRRTLNIAALMDRFDHFGHKQFLTWRNRLNAAGYSVGDGTPLEVRTAYQGMLTDVAQRQAAIMDGGMGRKNLTPVKYLNELIRMGGGDPSKLGGGGGPRTVTSTSTTKDVYELDPGEARTIMTKTLQEYLGRDPNKSEVADFMDAVSMSAEDDPTIRTATTRTRVGADGVIKNRTTSYDDTTGYTDDDAMWDAVDKAKASPDYGEYQAVSTYYPVIESVLGAAV